MKQSSGSASLSGLMSRSAEGHFDTLLAWYFVIVWGSGFLGSKTGMLYTAPFTFLSMRYMVGMVCLVPLVLILRPAWPMDRRELFHTCVAGLLMHAVNLSGSHYSQYWGMSAGVTALLLATQPLFTAMVSYWVLGDRLSRQQWLGVPIGFVGVALVVWHKINVHAISIASLGAVGVSLAAITTGTLYQRIFCKTVDLRSASLIQLMSSALLLIPLAYVVEGFVIHWTWQLVSTVAYMAIFASILAVNALHSLMRRGHATKVTSLFYLTPIVAVLLEWMMFGVVPTISTLGGIVVTCSGVALVTWNREARAPADS